MDTEKKLQSNVFKTALLFEGGSMRGAYTCAVVAYLLEQGVYFDNVYGVSAGSSNAVNYVSRDVDRAIRSFTDFVTLPNIGDTKTFLQHKGMFNAHYIYQEAGKPGGIMPFDFDTFAANPAKVTIPAFQRNTGRDVFFTKDQMATLDDVMVRVRASSTIPVFMPPPKIKGQYYYDGGFCTGGGLPLERIAIDGFDHVFVVRTRKRGYRKEGDNNWAKAFFARRPYMRDAVLTRNTRYNVACDLLDQWESMGRAHVFYAEELTLTGQERDYDELQKNFESGYAQIKRDFGKLEEFLAKAEA